MAQKRASNRRQLVLPVYTHDLNSWFLRFATILREFPDGNPMTALMEADAEVNPDFVAFGLYWYRVPGETVADRGHRVAEAVLGLLRKLPNRLRKSADDIPSVSRL